MVARMRDLQVSFAEVETSTVVSAEGLSIASTLPHELERDRISSMYAAMLSLGGRIASEFGRGSFQQV